MILEYLVFNARLIMQMLGIGDSYTSHRAGMEIEAEEFWSYLKYILLYNDNAATDLHRYWIPVVALTVCFCLLRYHSAREEEKHRARQLLAIVLFMFGLYFFAALWNMEPVVVLREKLGGLGSFQATRVIWLTPACWYFALAVSVDYWLSYILNMTKVSGITASGTLTSGALVSGTSASGEQRKTDGCVVPDRPRIQRLLTIEKNLMALIIYAGLCAAFLLVLKNNQIKENIQLLRNPDYHVITYEDYYALDVMDQVEDYIRDELGMEMEEYRVISLGIDPAAALVHGFYCMDGYSNNYDLEYKNLFRTFMATELERNEYIRSYYDDWGNRVYLFTAELTTYVNVEKGSFWFNDLQIDTAAIKDAGCDFIFSAAYVVNAEELNMELLAIFETEESYYRIYLYWIN